MKLALIIGDVLWFKWRQLFDLSINWVRVRLGYNTVLRLSLNPGGVWLRRNWLLFLVSWRLPWMPGSSSQNRIYFCFLRRRFWLFGSLFWLAFCALLSLGRKLAVFKHWVNVLLDWVSLERKSVGHILEFQVYLGLLFEFEVRWDVFRFKHRLKLSLTFFIFLFVDLNRSVILNHIPAWAVNQVISLIRKWSIRS